MNNYQIISILGEGKFCIINIYIIKIGNTWKVMEKTTNIVYAMKATKTNEIDNDEMAYLEKEAKV